MLSKAHRNAPVRRVLTGAFAYLALTCGYCRNPQLRNRCVEKCPSYSADSSTTSSTSGSAAASSSASAVSSSVTPTRTLTVAVISR